MHATEKLALITAEALAGYAQQREAQADLSELLLEMGRLGNQLPVSDYLPRLSFIAAKLTPTVPEHALAEDAYRRARPAKLQKASVGMQRLRAERKLISEGHLAPGNYHPASRGGKPRSPIIEAKVEANYYASVAAREAPTATVSRSDTETHATPPIPDFEVMWKRGQALLGEAAAFTDEGNFTGRLPDRSADPSLVEAHTGAEPAPTTAPSPEDFAADLTFGDETPDPADEAPEGLLLDPFADSPRYQR